jgi:hypothetical protein
MIKPILDIVNQLDKQLLILPAIVDEIAQKNIQSPDKLINWLRLVEQDFQKAGFSECAEIAGLRASMLSPELRENSRSSKKKERLLHAANTVGQAQKIISGFIKPARAKIDESRSIIRQILLIVKPSGILDYPEGVSFNDYIQGSWHALKTNDQLGAGINKILAVLNQSDAIRIFAEEIDMAD